jgi:hypothetical protein
MAVCPTLYAFEIGQKVRRTLNPKERSRTLNEFLLCDRADKYAQWLALPEVNGDPEKAERLQHYASGSLQEFYQYDGFYLPDGGDSLMRPEEDGDCLFRSRTLDLRHSPSELAVRVQIHEKVDPEVVIRLLRKLAAWVESESVCRGAHKPTELAMVEEGI